MSFARVGGDHGDANVNLRYDPVGMIAQSMKCIAWNGRLLVVGFAAGDIEKMATNRILLKNVSVVGVSHLLVDRVCVLPLF